MSNRDRRDFLKQSGLLAGAAGALASGVEAPAAAQTGSATQSRAVRRADRYDDSFIFEINDMPSQLHIFARGGGRDYDLTVCSNVEFCVGQMKLEF